MKISKVVTGNIHSIETFGAFDGPGLRYVVFLQGCNLRCKFCHNRDTWSTKVNKQLTVDEILSDYHRYKPFYKDGGITVSGGEATLQLDFLIELFKRCKEAGIHTCLDTSAGTFTEKKKELFDQLLKYTDLVLLDIKHIDNEAHKWLVGVPNTNILSFARYLSEVKKPTIIRHVLIPTITDLEIHLKTLRKFLDSLTNLIGIDVLPYHTMGISKWKSLGLEYPLQGIKEPTMETVKRAEMLLKDKYQFMA